MRRAGTLADCRPSSEGGGPVLYGTSRESCGHPAERIIQEVVRHAQAFFNADVGVDGVRDLMGGDTGTWMERAPGSTRRRERVGDGRAEGAAYRAEGLNYNAGVAAEWGRTHFPAGIPEATVLEHAARLKGVGGDFTAMVAQQLQSLAPGRLNARRVDSLAPGNPERSKMRDLARGMHVPLEPGFVPNGADSETRTEERGTETGKRGTGYEV